MMKNFRSISGPRSPSTISASRNVMVSDRLPKTLVIYFPQYHRDPLNDKNWGENFTDWDSLRGTDEKNRFNQIIPRPQTEDGANTNDDVPPPLGYYDLTDREPRETQGILAKKYGIDGFIYHTYWFYDESSPGPTLAKPLENMLKDGHPDMPFMLNWCAVKWVNVWMGKAIFQTGPTNMKNALILQEQYFNATQDMIHQHYLWLKPFFDHPNYIRVDGQPAFLLYYYDDQALPILESLRRFAIKDGFPGVHFIVGRSSHPEELLDTSDLLDDEHMRYQLKKKRQPRSGVDPTQKESKTQSIYVSSPKTFKRQDKGETWDYNPFNQTMTYPYPLDYVTKPFVVPDWCIKQPTSDISNIHLALNNTRRLEPQHHPEIIGVITTFDNTPRRKFKDAHIWKGSGKKNKGESKEEALDRFSKSYQAALYYQKCCVVTGAAPVGSSSVKLNAMGSHGDDGFVAINSWNEWGEGMAIEPSNVYGYRWLETIQSAMKQVEEQPCVRG